jgi:hypothetical protein
MRRKRFSESQVIETLHHCGIDVLCYRCKLKLEPGQKIEREHLTEIAMGGADEPKNCAYCHKACHAVVTNGTKATSAGSSKSRLAKIDRITGVTKTKAPAKIAGRGFQKGHRPVGNRHATKR